VVKLLSHSLLPGSLQTLVLVRMPQLLADLLRVAPLVREFRHRSVRPIRAEFLRQHPALLHETMMQVRFLACVHLA
jgi:hypothetical protein